MEIIIQPNADEASMIAARHVARLVRDKPNAVLGLATGSTPLMMYRELVRMHKEQGLDFSEVTTFNLDEYVGLSPDHPASYHAFMWDNFFSHINVKRERVHVPDGQSSHVPAFCRKYEEAIVAAGGIDLQVLGIGSDGHIGFNEPSSSLASRTRIKTLTAQTREDNAKAFGSADQVPFHVITMGVGTIMDTRHVIILAFGEKKAEAIAGAVEGPITAMNPASILQMHPVATCIIDEGAATKLKRTEYYRWVYDRKPDWQKL
ncbi:glucosamine-6-phosphate isomerase [Chthoniobacter flavus Ellin428]|uniref:Glucosamine-6-phosphate deaminase n=1 Tax=Chthoniobacter flavus Ellin428 TaxID=497964 RepID=B4D7X3_9BACT|nr:glucosamine-6-phosphate deaminase [Chthoniobacter flavus]EDY17496.1 glucosamine-6-phosphate isomerase [Chthoniobacter flavus Ellin428]TCO92291.1 glucosamine-6-phosphate deaminase [Chthoniobacter flavus]